MKHEITVPAAGESVTEAFIGKWHKNQGDYVRKGDVLVELESQKATMELESEYSGKLEVYFPTVGAKLSIGEVIATVDDSVIEENASVSTPNKQPEKNPPISPSVRREMTEKNIDPETVSGSGKHGRILKEDLANPQLTIRGVQPYAKPAPGPMKGTPLKPEGLESPKARSPISSFAYTGDTSRGVKRTPATRIRQEIAKNLVLAQRTAAILTTFNEVDMSIVMDYRKANKEKMEKEHGFNPGITSFFAIACARALKMYPLVNSFFTGDEIVSHDYVDISIAVSTDRGLVVPVMKDVDKLSVISFEKNLGDVSKKAREGKLSIPEMTGGTFTITNGGVFGSLVSTPILNMPQSAVLGLHKIEKRAVVIEDQIVIRPMMYLALSYDHRLIDGKDAVQFLVAVKEGIENIKLLLEAGK